MKIWKWDLRLIDKQSISLPVNAKILSVAMQGHTLCMWALCDPENDVEPRTIHILGTGNPLPADINKFHYLSTFQLDSGSLVFHVFEEQ